MTDKANVTDEHRKLAQDWNGIWRDIELFAQHIANFERDVESRATARVLARLEAGCSDEAAPCGERGCPRCEGIQEKQDTAAAYRAAAILCETRWHTGRRPCDFCLNVTLFESASANKAAPPKERHMEAYDDEPNNPGADLE